MTNNRVIRPNELVKILSVSRPTLWRMEKKGELPKRRKISTGSVGWLEKDIEEWLENRPFVGEDQSKK